MLFADIVGFTTLSESRDPEVVRELLTHYFDTARTVIGRYGGVVEKFIGDAVMAVWGTPTATEGDAERAVRAGLDLVDAVAALGVDVGTAGLALRAGVVTGEVAVTLGAVGQGMVAGDAVNTAARVQSTAGPGQVWVDEATRRSAGAAVGFVAEGEHALKGKAEPVALFRATRVLAMVGGSQRVDGLEAPLVGRDAELRTIKELLHATVDRSTPRLVVISGPAGVGKSRLGWEFEKYSDGLAEQLWWHRGRCLSYGEGVTYWALAEMVRQRFAVAEEDALDVAAAKLVETLPDFVPDPAERDYVGPRLARLIGVPYPGTSGETLSQEELFAGWRLFFERMAETRPVVLLVEDAHHADRALLDFLDHLVDWARNAPIYVLVFGRSELTEQHSGWGVGRNRSLLNLDLLDERSMDALVNDLVPDMPASAAAAITGQAQGNPLFAIETIRSLIDRDIVVPVEGQYRLVGDVAGLAVPDSLHGLFATRLDALDPQLRALVADAAVLGTSFPSEALVAVSKQPAAEVQAGLGDLVRRGVLEISADPLSPQRGSYHFAQSMLRQVAYDTLSHRDRKTRHLAVAAHLTATFATEEIAEVVARHYLDALDAVPDDPDTADVRAHAIEALLRAATRAESSGAPARAAADYATAAELTTAHDADRLAAAKLWERATAAAETAGAMADMRRYAETARDIYAGVGHDRDAARAATQMGDAVRALGHTKEARLLLTAALDTLRPDPDADTVAALRRLASLEIFDGSELGPQLAEEALVLGQALDLPDAELASIFSSRGGAYAALGQYGQAIAMFSYGVELAQRARDTRQQAYVLLNLASTLAALDAAAAADAAQRAYELARRMGVRRHASIALVNLAIAQLMLGQWDAAEQALADGVNDGLEEQYLPGCMSFFAALRGDLAAATAVSALPGCRASEDPQDRSTALLADALIAAADHRPADALRHALQILDYEAALGLVSEFYYLGWPTAARAAFDLGDRGTVTELLARLDAHPIGHLPRILRAERALARARLLADAHDPAANAALADAVTQLRAAGSPYHLAHGLLDHARYRREAREGDVEALVAEAAGIADLLGARPLAERAAAIRSTATAVAP